MKIKTKCTTEVTIHFTRDEVEQTLINATPKRFGGKFFTVEIHSDGSATLTCEEVK